MLNVIMIPHWLISFSVNLKYNKYETPFFN